MNTSEEKTNLVKKYGRQVDSGEYAEGLSKCNVTNPEASFSYKGRQLKLIPYVLPLTSNPAPVKAGDECPLSFGTAPTPFRLP